MNITCPKCGASGIVDNQYAGKSIACPSCGTVFECSCSPAPAPVITPIGDSEETVAKNERKPFRKPSFTPPIIFFFIAYPTILICIGGIIILAAEEKMRIPGAGMIVFGVFIFGIAQIFHLLGRIEYNTRVMMEYQLYSDSQK